MKIYNTLTRTNEEVKPIEGDTIRIYSCGLTVYDYAHIGNLRKYIFDDVLKRTLEYFSYKVKHVQNVTDVGHLTSDEDTGEDKVETGAAREGKTAAEITKFYEKAFIEDLKKLNILLPDEMPRATENIPEQIELIKKLEEKGFTYKTSDGIYFDTSKLEDYGKLARLDIENLEEGSRVVVNPEKRNITDFALWKFSHLARVRPLLYEGRTLVKRQQEWDSPWGLGFPGWHLECSAMATKFLGQPFEIHTGGVDHIPVHHTNEIAQSEAAYDKPLAKYWMHGEHLLEGGRKMAKSAGHFIRLQDLQEKGYSPLDFRYLCLQAHYRSKLDFSYQSLDGARSARRKMTSAYNSECHPELTVNRHPELVSGSNARVKPSQAVSLYSERSDLDLKEFDTALADDLDTPKALAFVFQNLNKFSRANFEKIDSVLGILEKVKIQKIDGLTLVGEIPQEVIELAKARQVARAAKEFDKSDALRKQIEEKGFAIEDLKDITKLIKQ